MKYISSALFLSVAVASAGALHTPESEPPVQKRTCGDPTTAAPFYRSYNPTGIDHFYTTNVNLVNEVNTPTGWALQEVAAFVFATQEESTVPFYRLFNPTVTDNFYTTSTTEVDSALQNGYALVTFDEFTYIYPTQVCGSVPFYRLYSASGTDNFYTTSESERLDFITNQGYTDIEIAGYVLPVAPTQCD